MTAQINDFVVFRRRDHSIAAISGSGMFDPAQQGLSVRGFSTACWRGYFCNYEIVDGALLLDRVQAGLQSRDEESAKTGEGPLLFGTLPKRVGDTGYFVYEDLRQPVDFSGGLLLAADFIRELYVHMGFHPAWKYETVFEVVFKHGRVVEEWDRSREMDLFREKIAHYRLAPSPGRGREAIGAWVANCFSRDYPSVTAVDSVLGNQATDPIPTRSSPPVPEFLMLDPPLICPHCEVASTQYRLVISGRLVCLACSRSFPRHGS